MCSALDGSGNVVDATVVPNATLSRPCPEPCHPIAKPIVDSSSTVYVIFGLKKIDRSRITREHVIEEKVNTLFTQISVTALIKFFVPQVHTALI